MTQTNKTEAKYKVGDKIYFKEDVKPFKIRACSDRFLICTKPYNFRPETVLYSIVDFKREIRGEDNLVFGIYDYYSDESCKEALESLKNGKMEVSHRKWKHVDINITKVKKLTKQQ